MYIGDACTKNWGHLHSAFR